MKHIFIEHPVTGRCIVCEFSKLTTEAMLRHYFVQYPTNPCLSLYNCPVVENYHEPKIATKKCGACE